MSIYLTFVVDDLTPSCVPSLNLTQISPFECCDAHPISGTKTCLRTSLVNLRSWLEPLRLDVGLPPFPLLTDDFSLMDCDFRVMSLEVSDAPPPTLLVVQSVTALTTVPSKEDIVVFLLEWTSFMLLISLETELAPLTAVDGDLEGSFARDCLADAQL